MDNNLLKQYLKINNEPKNILERQYQISKLKDINVPQEDLKKILPVININDDKIILISDTHYGSLYENYDYIKLVYEFADNNSINHIIHGGDFIQGTYAPLNNKKLNIYEQLIDTLSKYPNETSIQNYILLGNHDYLLIRKSIDIAFKIFSLRKDIKILGLKQAYINWKKYLISINHRVPKIDIHIPRVETQIKFYGHRHEFNYKNGYKKVFLPSLSDDIKYYGNIVYPGFIIAELTDSITFKFYPIINNKIYDNCPSLRKELIIHDNSN